MGNKGGSRTLKRYSSPVGWPIRRKEYKWVIKPSPGPHAISASLPLLVVLREMLGVVHNSHEAKVVLNQGRVKVNGRTQGRLDLPVGVMDVVSISDADIYTRMVPKKGKLVAHSIPKEERDFRILRIENKTCVAGLKVQLNLTGGANLLLPVESAQATKNLPYSTMDTLKMDVTATKILGHHKLKVGSYVLAVRGKNSGEHGSLMETVGSFKKRNALAKVQTQAGGSFETILDYLYVIGEEKPEISLPEVS